MYLLSLLKDAVQYANLLCFYTHTCSSPRNDQTGPSHQQSDQDGATERDDTVKDSVVVAGFQSEHVEPMSENTLRQAAAAVEIFGQEVVRVL